MYAMYNVCFEMYDVWCIMYANLKKYQSYTIH